ncbi:MAG TPA: MaoC/PaaZ C-terminal domain-containing protein [Actinomycetota bacterium]|nr:MaoC/PaaZ C-terminal domain-containing protein [Actinomycetota bacterium]
MAAKVKFADVNAGEELKSWEYKVERIHLVMYAGASGDFNPIHWNETFAKAVGLPDVIATGMHTMGRIGQFVTDWCGDPASVVRFKNRFTSPVVVPQEGQTVSVSGRVVEKLDDNMVRLELSADVGETNVSKAEAVVRLA